MRVRAVQTGFYGSLHIPGTDSEEFDVQDGEKASWFVPVDKPRGKKASADTAQDQPDGDLV